MDVNSILLILVDKTRAYLGLSGKELLQALNYKEYVGIESKKHDLFLQRIEFICMANCLKQAMARESGYKQLKRDLVNEWGMSDADAQHDPDKYNERSRMSHKFPVIINNCSVL